MTEFSELFTAVYQRDDLGGVDRPLDRNPFVEVAPGVRPNSIAVEGGAFGDEGKGRVVDEVCGLLIGASGRGVVYRWNGGANAGHTVILDGRRLALHQLPSGVLFPGATVVLGKGMVLHPGDLLAEIAEVHAIAGGLPATLRVDAQAVLALDTHRALENVLKRWASGGHGATGRGISPAYADVLYRHPLRARDLIADDWQDRLGHHYDLYAAMIGGLGGDLAAEEVVRLSGAPIPVGSRAEFLARLEDQRAALRPYIHDLYDLLRDQWANPDVPFVFEGAQAVGLDPRYGVYPDVTASDPTFYGIIASTEGIVKTGQIAIRLATIKATYTSSVGTRRLPTAMDSELAGRIREDAHEYGATTKRPRDIAYLDLPCLRFFADVSGATHLVLTHLDIAYPEVPIQVCTHYLAAQDCAAGYRPDQAYLDTVRPQYLDLPSWDGAALQNATALDRLPAEAMRYITFVSRALEVTPLFATTGPAREALISWLPG
jgi:adenylosuccinate synthase